MIFIVVGSQEPFDRLIKAVDLWASENKHKNVFAQIGKTNLRPRHINWTEFLPPQVFEEKLKQAQIIISHAGMGTILNALYHSKPIIVMPRLFHFHEQRNDHQLATARSLSRLGYISVAYNEFELRHKLQRIEYVKPYQAIGPHASMSLINEIRNFIFPERIC